MQHRRRGKPMCLPDNAYKGRHIGLPLQMCVNMYIISKNYSIQRVFLIFNSLYSIP